MEFSDQFQEKEGLYGGIWNSPHICASTKTLSIALRAGVCSCLGVHWAAEIERETPFHTKSRPCCGSVGSGGLQLGQESSVWVSLLKS